MGYIKTQPTPTDIFSLKEMLNPYADNDFIRNAVYSFVERHPEKRLALM